MIFGLQPAVFFSFLVWPIVYIVIAIIMYFVMASHDKKEEAWEKAYDEWEASTGYHNPLDLSKDTMKQVPEDAKAEEGGEDR